MQSLGARFVKVDLGETGETKDGYAKELTEEQLAKQREAMKRLENLEILIDESRDRLDIRLVDHHKKEHVDFWDIFDPDRWGSRGAVVDFDLFLPHEMDLRLETDEGDVEVVDLLGDINIGVDEGDVTLRDIDFGNIRIDVDEGDADFRNIYGREGIFTFRGDEGRFRMNNADFLELDVATDEGEILLGSASLRNCDLSSDEGDVEVEFEVHRGDKYRISTDEGDIYISLPDNADISYDLEAEEGSIRSDFDIEVDELDDGERARGRIGRGEASLDVFSGEGDITLDKK